jgi:hypothetical protein
MKDQKKREKRRDLFISKLISNNIHGQTGHLRTVLESQPATKDPNNTVITYNSVEKDTQHLSLMYQLPGNDNQLDEQSITTVPITTG